MATSREVTRDALVALLTTDMIGVNQAQTVTGHKLDTIEGKAPVVYVRSAGTFRERITFDEDLPRFKFDVIIYVHQSKGTWTDANACDMADKLESLLADVIQTYRKTTDWDLIGYAGPSVLEEIELGTGGNRYYKETVPLFINLDTV